MAKSGDGAEFVKWLMAEMGLSSPTEFAARMRQPESSVYRWLRGEGAPRFKSAMAMMRAAGVLDQSAPGKPTVLPPAIQAILEQSQRSFETAILEVLASDPEGAAAVYAVPALPRSAEQISQELEAVAAREEALQRELADALVREEPPARKHGKEKKP